MTAEVDALKVVEEDPAGTVTDAGTVIAPLLLETAVTAPPVAAGAESVTVQLLETPPVTAVGVHRIEERVAPGAVIVSVVVTDPPP